MESQPSDASTSRWTTIYPTYLDKNATVSGGRRVSKTIAIDNPRIEEIRLVCERLKVPYLLEKEKLYPRDFMNPGRIRVSLSAPGIECKSKTKSAFLREIAQLIAQLKSRKDLPVQNVQVGGSKSSKQKRK